MKIVLVAFNSQIENSIGYKKVPTPDRAADALKDMLANPNCQFISVRLIREAGDPAAPPQGTTSTGKDPAQKSL